MLQEPEKGQNQVQYDLLQQTTWNLQATKLVPATEELDNLQQQENSGSAGVTKSTIPGKIPPVKEFNIVSNNSEPENSSLHLKCDTAQECDAVNNNKHVLGIQSNCLSLPSMEECIGTVYFLQSSKIHGRHEILVRMQFSQQHRRNADHLLFEPDQSVLHQLGLDIEFALLSIDEDNIIVLMYLCAIII